MSLSFLFKKMSLLVVYYDQHLGAGHSKRWLKQSFTAFFMAKSCKKAKESKKFAAKFQKKLVFLGIKHSTSVQVLTQNPLFCSIFLKICYFFAFFQLFRTKNPENDYFNQHLGYPAPKRWSKYTTFEKVGNFLKKLIFLKKIPKNWAQFSGVASWTKFLKNSKKINNKTISENQKFRWNSSIFCRA